MAESCVFDKQSLEPILCGSPIAEGAPLVPKVRGHFAEFLHEGSPERLRILAWHTCVGLRYGPRGSSPTGFSRPDGHRASRSSCRPCGTGVSSTPTRIPPASPAGSTFPSGWRNINRLSIGYALGPRLRSRLTLGGLTFPRKPCAFGGRASHPSCRYSFRHTHSTALHWSFPSSFDAAADALLPFLRIRDCGATLSPRHFRRGMARPVSCYALLK